MFIRNLILLAILFLLVLLQTSFLPVFTAFFPDIPLLIILALCWAGRRDAALWAAFWGGVLYDFLTVRLLGVRSLLLLAAVSGVSLIHRRVDSLLSRFLSAFLISLGWRLYPAYGGMTGSFLFILEKVALLALLDAVLFIIFFPMLSALFERIFSEGELQLSFKDRLR